MFFSVIIKTIFQLENLFFSGKYKNFFLFVINRFFQAGLKKYFVGVSIRNFLGRIFLFEQIR